MDFYALERLVAERQAEIRHDLQRAALAPRPGRMGVALAAALRNLADRLDGGRPAQATHASANWLLYRR